jgi:hypothetical protein
MRGEAVKVDFVIVASLAKLLHVSGPEAGRVRAVAAQAGQSILPVGAVFPFCKGVNVAVPADSRGHVGGHNLVRVIAGDRGVTGDTGDAVLDPSAGQLVVARDVAGQT